jgi:hypothetical protein
MSAIADAIKKAARSGTEIYLKLCTVDSVDETARTITCTPLDGTATLEDVNLQAVVEKKDGLLMVPKKGSMVAVGFFDKNNAVVLLYSEIEKIVLTVDSIEINGGANEGLVKVKELTEKINTIEKDTNTLKTALLGWSPTGTPADTATWEAAITPWGSQALMETQQEEIENKKIKH